LRKKHDIIIALEHNIKPDNQKTYVIATEEQAHDLEFEMKDQVKEEKDFGSKSFM